MLISVISFRLDQVEVSKTNESIKRFTTVDEVTGETEEMIDLENSVFMNFKRYTIKEVSNCFEADMRASNFEAIIKEDEEDLTQCALVFEKNYAAYCMCFHEVAAHYDNFPLINLTDLAEVLYEIGIYAKAKAEPIAARVIAKYRALRQVKDNEDLLLNRVKFTEVLLLVCESDHDMHAE